MEKVEKSHNKNSKVSFIIYIALAASVIGLGLWSAINLGSSQRTVPKINLSYFKSTDEFAQNIEQRLDQEISQQKLFFLGVEPGKDNQLKLAVDLKMILEKKLAAFDYIVVDHELDLKPAQIGLFSSSAIDHSLKEDWSGLADFLQKNSDKKILVVTAAIYSTNLLKENPLAKMKQRAALKPMTFSMGYFPIDMDDEKNNLFQCLTEDKSGTSDWGCVVLNKARGLRRKINFEKLKNQLTIGTLDLTGENDYMILYR